MASSKFVFTKKRKLRKCQNSRSQNPTQRISGRILWLNSHSPPPTKFEISNFVKLHVMPLFNSSSSGPVRSCPNGPAERVLAILLSVALDC